VVATIALTVVLSVVVHGVTAQPLTQSISRQSSTQSRHCVDWWCRGRLQTHRNRSGLALGRRDEQVQAELVRKECGGKLALYAVSGRIQPGCKRT
jgi:hypothetical protein